LAMWCGTSASSWLGTATRTVSQPAAVSSGGPLSGGLGSIGIMDVILIPGFWLNAASWDGVVPALEAAGHRVRALTLPGLAGFALSIGMAVDANVLINERIREELRAGRTVRSAIEAGYQNALPAILDSNVTTFLSGVILFQFGTGPIKGFAVTLCVGILTTVITAVYLTRTYYDLRISARKLERISI